VTEPRVEVTADVVIDGSLRYRLHLDPQCVAVVMSDRQYRIEVAHVAACGCGDMSARVRMPCPAAATADVVDDVERIDVGDHMIDGLRSPVLRAFRIEW